MTARVKERPTTPAVAAPAPAPAMLEGLGDWSSEASRFILQADAIVHHAYNAFAEDSDGMPESIFVLNALQHALALVYEAREAADRAWEAYGQPAHFGNLFTSLVSAVALLEVIDKTTWSNGGMFHMSPAIIHNYLWALNDIFEVAHEALLAIDAVTGKEVQS